MQINNSITPLRTQQIYTPRTEFAFQPVTPVPAAALVPVVAQNPDELDNSIVLSISKSSRVFYALSQKYDMQELWGVKKPQELQECQTCKNRKYVDQSDDPTVSFQTPTNISPESAAAAVAGHEGEHIRNEQANAERDGRRVLSQSVIMHTSICPECGRVYVSGGEARTVTVSDDKPDNQDAGDN